MPNHVINEIHASEEVLSALLNDVGMVDFEKITPVPEALFNKSVSLIIPQAVEYMAGMIDYDSKYAVEHLFGRILRDDYLFEDFLLCLKSMKETGHASWYSWNRHNWGTKWNAYNTEKCEGYVRFQTAWTYPQPIIVELSARFPEEIITHKYADEDLGYNLGEFVYRNEEREESIISDEKKFAIDLHGYQDDYTLIDGVWVYVEEIEEGGAE